ncbi:hypothetical protein GCM10027290_16900 [Micromonospora sonneratiae]|uniref:Peptidase inhibitor family I36 protein n=1 Tax=Micromonospora sonneratiae TaxID=1184706 RepID=A0ABW3YFF6_9ACTN
MTRHALRKRALALTAGLLLVGASLIVGSSPAAAKPVAGPQPAAGTVQVEEVGEGGVGALGLAACPSTYACFWVHDNYAGTMGKVEGNNPDFRGLYNSSGCTRYAGTWNDCITSIANRGTQCTVYFYKDAGYAGGSIALARNDEVANIGLHWGASWNDSISSNRWCIR